MKDRFIESWNLFKKDFPNRKTKKVIITNQSKRKEFLFVENGKVITLYPNGKYTVSDLPGSTVLI